MTKKTTAKLILFSLFTFLPGWPGGVFGQAYTITDLGALGALGGSYSEAHGINKAGSVAGEWGGAGIQNAFLYQDGLNSSILLDAVAHGLNNAGVVVGESGLAAKHGFSYSNGVPTDLGVLGGNWSIAWAINNSGQIVGESTISSLPNAEVHAIWWHGGLKTDLGVFPTGDYSCAYGINDSNVIVGESTVISGNVTNLYAFVYTDSMRSLGTLPGGNYSSAKAINNSGQIVGEASTAAGDTHAFLYSGGVMTDLGTLGGNLSSAAGLNSSGQVVGYSSTADGQQHAFLYNGSAMIDLNTVLPASSPFTYLSTAEGINDAGQIAGSGYTAGGDLHAFLLTPAAPVLWLSDLTALDNGQFRLTVNGTPGQQFVLLASGSLSDWTPASTNLLVTNTLTCTLSPAATNKAQFYRAQLLP